MGARVEEGLALVVLALGCHLRLWETPEKVLHHHGVFLAGKVVAGFEALADAGDLRVSGIEVKELPVLTNRVEVLLAIVERLCNQRLRRRAELGERIALDDEVEHADRLVVFQRLEVGVAAAESRLRRLHAVGRELVDELAPGVDRLSVVAELIVTVAGIEVGRYRGQFPVREGLVQGFEYVERLQVLLLVEERVSVAEIGADGEKRIGEACVEQSLEAPHGFVQSAKVIQAVAAAESRVDGDIGSRRMGVCLLVEVVSLAVLVVIVESISKKVKCLGAPLGGVGRVVRDILRAQRHALLVTA